MCNTNYTVEKLDAGTPVCISESFRFCEDSLLLAEFLNIPPRLPVLDLGAGCGILSLALYDRGHRGPITAVELFEEGCTLLNQSCKLGEIENIETVCGDLRQFSRSEKYAAVLCNPPYFQARSENRDTPRTAARSDRFCSFADLASAAARNLREGGRLFFCIPAERLSAAFCALHTESLTPKRMQCVRSAADKPARLVLIEARYRAGEGLKIEPEIRKGD